jgi:riboflavin synthase
MFTGIIERTGRIVSLEDFGGVKRLIVAAPGIAGRLREGDSLAVSGVCLTALAGADAGADSRFGELFFADLAAETLARTSLGELAPGAVVNLEMPTAAGAPLGGHIVQGHVDGTGRLVSLVPVVPEAGMQPEGTPGAGLQETDWWLTVQVPEHVRQYMVEKGSVAIEGISLTIARTTAGEGGDTIGIAILPLTYWRTNLHTLGAGAPLNVEADVLMKFAAMQMAQTPEPAKPEFEISEGWLVANGF